MDIIEIIEFYPIEKKGDYLTGTLRVKLVDLGIHILGIYVTKKKENFYFSMPGSKSLNHEGELIRYPFIVFEDREAQKKLMDAIRERGRFFIEHRLLDTENPLIFPHKLQRQAKRVEIPKTTDNATGPKETGSITNEKPLQSKQKVWQDLPPRKTPTKNIAYRK